MWIDPESPGEFDVAVGAQVTSVRGQDVGLVDDDKKVHYLKLFHCELSSLLIFMIRGEIIKTNLCMDD